MLSRLASRAAPRTGRPSAVREPVHHRARMIMQLPRDNQLVRNRSPPEYHIAQPDRRHRALTAFEESRPANGSDFVGPAHLGGYLIGREELLLEDHQRAAAGPQKAR